MALVPKIKIEVSFDELCELCDHFAELPDVIVHDRGNKVFWSVIEIVIEKLLKKQISKRYTSKKINLSFEYFEASFLEQWLIYNGNVDTVLCIQNIINKLNQKLA